MGRHLGKRPGKGGRRCSSVPGAQMLLKRTLTAHCHRQILRSTCLFQGENKVYEWCCLRLCIFCQLCSFCGILVPNWAWGPAAEAACPGWTAEASAAAVMGNARVDGGVRGAGTWTSSPSTCAVRTPQSEQRLHSCAMGGASSRSPVPGEVWDVSVHVSGQRRASCALHRQHTHVPDFSGLTWRLPGG